jgi:hypothetical protein
VQSLKKSGAALKELRLMHKTGISWVLDNCRKCRDWIRQGGLLFITWNLRVYRQRSNHPQENDRFHNSPGAR